MIYIDPPYNTGSDLIYEDNFSDNIKNYKEKMKDSYKTNTDTNGRYHTNWLNMIYPRLKLAKNLLCDDGVIFISIDDNEFCNLKKVCDEIYGENNCVGEIIRKTKSMTGDSSNGFNLQHESLLIYAKNKSNIQLIGKEKEFDNYKNPDNDPLGDWCSGDPSAKSGGESTYFPITNPYTNKTDYPPQGRYWAFSQDTLQKYIARGKIKFKREYKEGQRGFIFKRYKSEAQNQYNPIHSLFAIENEFMNQSATTELKGLFEASIFSYPKPTEFLYELVKCCSRNENDIILDFFAGSCTTAHAVMQLNSEDGMNRRFIMVQLPEEVDQKSDAYKLGYKNICAIGKERIRKAGHKILAESIVDRGKEDLDVGFKVFKLDSTNIKEWDDTIQDVEKIKQMAIELDNPVKVGRNSEDVLYEVLLKYGVDLTMPIEEVEMLGSKVYSVGFGYLMICLEEHISLDLLNEIGCQNPNRVVLYDNGLTNESKVNGEKILRNYGVKDIRTI